jgi:hypothetical protein
MHESNQQQAPVPDSGSEEEQLSVLSILRWRKAYDAKKALQATQLAEYLATLPIDNPEGSVIQISAQMLIHLLKEEIVSWFYVHADMPKNPEEFKERAEFIRWNAEYLGDMDAFILGIEYILAHPQIDAARFNDSRTPLSDHQMREILEYIKQKLWLDTLPVDIKRVKLVSMPLKDWYASHGKRPERTLKDAVLSELTLAHHLECLTDVVGLEDDFPEDLEGYYVYALDIQWSARREGYLEQLRLGIEYALGNPDLDIEFLMHEKDFCEPDEMRELLRYVWEFIWPNALPIPQGGPPGVSIAKLPPRYPATWD